MTAQIPESHRDLLANETQAFAYLATLMPDGSPQLTPIWFDLVDGRIRINTTVGRVKEENLRERRKLAFLVVDPNNPYRFIQIRGHVGELIEEGASSHIGEIADKYTGELEYRDFDRKARVTIMIEPVSVSVN
jgi:PPOX class probable F420-dependent enzyme